MSFTLTTSGMPGVEKGMIVEIGGKYHVVVRMVDASTAILRRTFRQWLSDVWDVIFFWVFD